ncbi:hypothetical protein [Agrobacterium sp. 22-223-1]
MSDERFVSYNRYGFSLFVSPSTAFNFSYAGFGWTTSYAHGERTVQATAGKIGMLLFFDNEGAFSGLGIGISRTQPYGNSFGTAFLGPVVNRDGLFLTLRGTGGAERNVGSSNLRPAALSGSASLKIISTDLVNTPYLYGSGSPTNVWSPERHTYLNRTYNYTGVEQVDSTRAWKGFDTPSERLAGERLRDARLASLDRRPSLSLEARDERARVAAAAQVSSIGPARRDNQNPATYGPWMSSSSGNFPTLPEIGPVPMPRPTDVVSTGFPRRDNQNPATYGPWMNSSSESFPTLPEIGPVPMPRPTDVVSTGFPRRDNQNPATYGPWMNSSSESFPTLPEIGPVPMPRPTDVISAGHTRRNSQNSSTYGDRGNSSSGYPELPEIGPVPSPRPDNSSAGSSGKPVLLDLVGKGLSIDKLGESSRFVDFDGDGFLRRTAWAGNGTGVLVLDANGDGVITRSKEFMFTEWDPSASGDLEAVKNVFDTNRNGVLEAGDKRWNEFKVSINGQLKSLKDLGIASINLTPTGSGQSFSDGSAIAGTTTFTRSDGSTGMVGDAILANEEKDYKISRSTMKNSDGTSSELIVGYAIDGNLAFRNLVTRSLDDSTVTTKFDDNGDGVFDRSQSKTISIEKSGSRIETIKNFNADSSLSSSDRTERTSDGLKITTTLDKNGDGSADERQLFEKFADGSSRTTTQQLHLNGTASKTVIINAAADGLSKTTSTDLTGDGVADRYVSDIKTSGKAAQERVVTELAGNGATLSKETTTTTTAAGIVTTLTDSDFNGDGKRDRGVEEKTFTNSVGEVVTERATYSRDKALLKKEIFRITADGRSKFTSTDVDGDGKNDISTSDIIAADAAGVWVHTKRERSVGGVLLSQSVVRIQPDRKNMTETFDKNGDDAVDTSVVMTTGPDGATTTTETRFNTDRSVVSRSSTVTSSNGNSTTVTNDGNGDGVVDSKIVTTRTTAPDKSSTVTIQTLAGNDKLVSQTISKISPDATSRSFSEDLDGDGVADRQTVDNVVLNSDGSRQKTVTVKSRNSTLLKRTTTDISADRRTTVVTVDSNGDGIADQTTKESTLADGQTVIEEKLFTRSGQAYKSSTKTVSANGLKTTVATDTNGNGVIDFTTVTETLVNDDGSRTETTKNVNINLRTFSSSTKITSGDGLASTAEQDLNGSGKAGNGRVVQSTTYDANGSITKSESSYSGKTLISRTETVTSGNGLGTVISRDLDGDGDLDRVLTTLRVINADGSTLDQELVKSGNGKLLSKTMTTVSGDQKSRRTDSDTNGDGIIDRRMITSVRADGVENQTIETLSRTGTVSSRHVTEVSANGFSTSWRTDLEGDGTFDVTGADINTISADGSRTTTVSRTRRDDGQSLKETTFTSADGLTKRVSWYEGSSVKKVQLDVTVLESDGGTTQTTTITKADGTLASREVRTESQHGLVSTLSRDTDGDGKIDQEITRSVRIDGSIEQKFKDFAADGKTIATKTINSRLDGVAREIVEYDFNGDGVLDKKIQSETIIGSEGEKGIWSFDYVMTKSGWKLTNRWLSIENADGLHTLKDFDTGGDLSKDYHTVDWTRFEENGERFRTLDARRNDVLESRRVVATSANELTTITLKDMTGAGKFVRTSTDVTVHTPDGMLQRTVLNVRPDGTELSHLTTTTTADGLTTETIERRAGLATRKTRSTTTLMADGSTTDEIAQFSIDNQLLSKILTITRADKRRKITSIDADGDGVIDQKRGEILEPWGEKISDTTNFGDKGAVLQRIISVTAADGLSSFMTWDLNGDGVLDQKRIEINKLNADGSRFVTRTDTDLIKKKTKSVSTDATRADGKLRTISKDLDGDGVFDQIETVETTITGQTKSKIISNVTARDIKYLPPGEVTWKNAIAHFVESENSVDGDMRTSRYDYDGDGKFETEMISRSNIDGSVNTDIVETTAGGSVVAKGSIFAAADGRTTILTKDMDSDGDIDERQTSVTRDDDSIFLRRETLRQDGTASASVLDEVDLVGTLTSRTTFDDLGRRTQQLTTEFDGGSRITTFDAMSGGLTNVSNVSSTGVLVSATLYDYANSKEWIRIEQTFDVKGHKTREKRFLDNGTSVTISFVYEFDGAGRKTIEKQFLDNGTSIITFFVPETGAQMKSEYFDASGVKTGSIEYDFLNNQPWREMQLSYNASGQVLTQIEFRDDGVRIEYAYDPANAQSWSRRSSQFDSSGRHSSSYQLNDDGTANATTLDAANTQPWSKIETTRDASDREIFTIEYVDDGHRNEYAYDPSNTQPWQRYIAKFDSAGRHYDTYRLNDDGTVNILMLDASNAKPWSKIETTRDASDRETFTVEYVDDGHRNEYSYDPSNTQPWQSYINKFDSAGRHYYARQLNDNGTANAMTLDPSNVQPWWKVEQVFDTAGRQTLQVEYLDNGNRTEITFDPSNSQPWQYYTNLFDSSGRHYHGQQLNDDGSLFVLDFDVNNTQHWWRHERVQDAAGRTNLIVTFNDDGTRTHYIYDAAENHGWSRIEQRYTSSGTISFQIQFNEDTTWDETVFDVDGRMGDIYSYTQRMTPRAMGVYARYDYDDGSYSVVHQYQTIYYDRFGNMTGWENNNSGGFHESDQDMSPVVIDLNDDGHIDLKPLDTSSAIAVNNQSLYDWNSDGAWDATAWVGPQDGFLAINLGINGASGSDGVINQAKELAFTLWPTEEQGSTNSDLEALRFVFDTNNDGLLSAEDARWSEFRVWQDINQNGLSEAGELSTLDQLGIKYINLIPTPDGAREFMDGSAITGTSFLEKVDGKTQLVGDVRLAYQPSPAFA